MKSRCSPVASALPHGSSYPGGDFSTSRRKINHGNCKKSTGKKSTCQKGCSGKEGSRQKSSSRKEGSCEKSACQESCCQKASSEKGTRQKAYAQCGVHETADLERGIGRRGG